MTEGAPAGERIELRTATGDAVAAWHVRAPDARRAGLVVLHAIWGVTPHIRALCAEFAEDGYETLAPSLLGPALAPFPDADLNPAALAERVALAEVSGHGAATPDRVQLAIDALAPPVMVMGFCFGGTAAWLAAARCDGLSAASCFYGGQIALHANLTPRCPTILHYGKHDPLIPPEGPAKLADRYPEMPIHLYDAGHAFMAPSDYHADSARLAKLRTLQLFHRAAVGRGEMGG